MERRSDCLIPWDVLSARPLYHISYLVSCLLPKWRLYLPEEPTESACNDSYESIAVGSKAERLHISSEYHNRLKENMPAVPMRSDDDLLVVYRLPCTIGRAGDTHSHISLDTSATKPGYLRLRHRSTCGPAGEPVRRDMWIELENMCQTDAKYGVPILNEATAEIHRCITLAPCKRHLARCVQNGMKANHSQLTDEDLKITLSGPAVTLDSICLAKLNDSLEYRRSYDYTLAVKCSHWPEVASEWPLRTRTSGWPREELIQEIVDGGCHLVQFPHINSTHPTIEWRWSFTDGEKKLALSLSDNQRRCYIAFKTVVGTKLRPSTVVSSYCMKNILFWKMDQVPQEVWDHDLSGLGTGFIALLDGLIHSLAGHNIRHYFIRENNLIGHKPREAVVHALKQVSTIRKWVVEEILCFDYVHRLSSSIFEPLSLVLGDTIEVDRPSYEPQQTMLEYKRSLLASIVCRLRYVAMDSWDNDFSEAMCEGVKIKSDFFMEYMKRYPRTAQLKQADYRDEAHETARYITGVPWGCFIYSVTSADVQQSPIVSGIIEEMFKLARQRVKSFQYCFANSSARFALFLQKCKKYHEAIGICRQVLDVVSHSMPEVRWIVCISEQSAKAFDACFQEAMTHGTKAFTALTVVAMACHIMLGCCLSLNMADQARSEVVPFYQQHCMAFYESDKSQAKISSGFIFYLLAQSLQKLGLYQEAISKYTIIRDKTQNIARCYNLLENIKLCTEELERVSHLM